MHLNFAGVPCRDEAVVPFMAIFFVICDLESIMLPCISFRARLLRIGQNIPKVQNIATVSLDSSLNPVENEVLILIITFMYLFAKISTVDNVRLSDTVKLSCDCAICLDLGNRFQRTCICHLAAPNTRVKFEMSTGDSFSEAAVTGDPDDSDPDYEIGDRLETIDEYKPPSKTRKRIKKERFVYFTVQPAHITA